MGPFEANMMLLNVLNIALGVICGVAVMAFLCALFLDFRDTRVVRRSPRKRRVVAAPRPVERIPQPAPSWRAQGDSGRVMP